MTWISAHRPQRKTPRVYREPRVQPGRRPCPQSLGSCCPRNWGQIGPGGGGPAHSLCSPCGPHVVGWAAGSPCVCLEGWPPVWPERSRQTVSPPQQLVGSLWCSQVPIGHHCTCELAVEGRLRESMHLPSPNICLSVFF